ncbi:MAG: phosphoglucomutase/phosphomannomutase family protein [Actinobacteria bacterium]|nr:phosphoglucomutase/phosphomannomutase family protein [Actinomycetota bacterium]
MDNKRKIKFGTDGWRDIIADNFTFENVRLVAFAIGRYLIDNGLTQKGIFIGYDNRFLSEDFALQAGYALSSLGIKIFLSKESVPTPITAFMVLDLKLDGAIMITASHNPPEYNGIKFIPYYGGPAEDSITKEIEKNLNSYIDKTWEVPLLKKYEDFLSKIIIVSDYEKYKKHLFKIINISLIKKADLKVAADVMFGAGSHILSEILDLDLNLKTKIFNSTRDAFFGGKLPDPSAKNLETFKNEILKNAFEIGLALDGDADRFGVIDNRGVFISPNNVISLILYYLAEVKQLCGSQFKAVRSVATTHLIDEICLKYKINIVETPVGFKYVGKEMQSGNAVIGGEESGGLSIIGHIPEKDGILACLLLLEIQSYLKLQKNNLSLSQYLENIYEEFGDFYTERIDMHVPLEKMAEIAEYFKNLSGSCIKNIKITEILTKDGVKLLLDNKSWFLIRASGTEPLIRCYIEARNKAFFEFLKNYINDKIESLKK